MKIFLDMVGCRLNQSEIEMYARHFRMAGHTLVASADEADMAVVNTCAVTSAAESDSRQKIRQAARAGAKQIVVTGCWSTLQPQSAAALPSVTDLVPNWDKDRLVSRLLQIDPQVFDREFIEREPLPGERSRTRAFIKVQDGCNNRCTYCITSLARGPERSRPVAVVSADVRAALQGGAREIVLSGVHLGSWGKDFVLPLSLAHLVQSILEQTETPRLRLSSLEPWDLTPEFFALWQDERLCRHLHLPLQSGSAATLQRMARKTTPDSFAELVEAARCSIPEVAITTDIIVGFPGEDRAEFEESLAFVERMRFAGGHVFTYSARPGTAAARMPHQVAYQQRKERNAQMRVLLDKAAYDYQASFLGDELPVLWESITFLGSEQWLMSGLTDNYLRVTSQGPSSLWNTITPVRLAEITSDGLRGLIGR